MKIFYNSQIQLSGRLYDHVEEKFWKLVPKLLRQKREGGVRKGIGVISQLYFILVQYSPKLTERKNVHPYTILHNCYLFSL